MISNKNQMDFNQKYLQQTKNKLIAVDYDSTITLHRPYPEKADLDPVAKKYLDKLNKLGFRLILWTARVGEDYKEALDRCHNEFGLQYIESDSKELIHGETGKLVASFYIEDNSYPKHKVPWKKIYKYLEKKYK